MVRPGRTDRTALIVGASRTLGLGLARELLDRGWTVVGTVRGTSRTGLHDLAADSGGRLEIEKVDVTVPDEVGALRRRLGSRSLDLLFVNAGVAHDDVPAGEVSTESFVTVMVTNALAPMRVVEELGPLVAAHGAIGVMSSRQGSLTLNTAGGNDVYRASKSALNQLMRSYAARHADDPRALLLVSPGHVRTELGGADAPLTVEQSVPGVADTIERYLGTPGLRFVDRENRTIPG